MMSYIYFIDLMNGMMGCLDFDLYNCFKAKEKRAFFDCAFLHAESPRSSAPKNTLIKLWPHQEAMLYRCQQIELAEGGEVTMLPINYMRYNESMRPNKELVKLCIMNDPPGSGKTFVCLSLMAQNKKSRNLVIVPMQIHHQWVKAIEAFFKPGKFKYSCISSYGDTLNIPLDSQCIISSTLYCDALVNALSHQKIKFDRIFIDEIDTIGHNRICGVPKCNKIWFVSGTYCIDEFKQLGAFDMKNLTQADLEKRVCKCSSEFVRLNTNLPGVQTFETIVPDGDIIILKGIVTNKCMRYINSSNLEDAKREYLHRFYEYTINSVFDLATVKVTELNDEKASLIEHMIATSEIISRGEGNDNNINELKKKLLLLKQSLANVDDHLKKLELNLSSYKVDESVVTLNEKIQVCVNIIKEYTDKNKSILIYNDDDLIFDKITELLKQHNITCENLRGGTKEKIEAALHKYRSKEVQVLYLSSMTEGVGMNLENAGALILLHKLNESEYNQIVSRAQRPGRDTQLIVHHILYKNEKL